MVLLGPTTPVVSSLVVLLEDVNAVGLGTLK